MFVLDTNHLRESCYTSALNRRLMARLSESEGDTVTTIISAEEATRGWLATIAWHRDAGKQVWAYGELEKLFKVFTGLIRLPLGR